MKIIKSIKEMQTLGKELKDTRESIGFIPTMGALHGGHLSLIRTAKNENNLTVVSIFVNPTQFGPDEDFNKYPRDSGGDLKKLSSLDVDIVFMPGTDEMYLEDRSVSIDIGPVGNVLCGASRPGHFNGVATVVAKLFNIVMPSRAYFGQKDYQQTVVIKKLVNDINFDLDIVVCPISREPDGLAMSSRNIYLSHNERRDAAVLYRALKHGKQIVLSGKTNDPRHVISEMVRLVNKESDAIIDYTEIVDPENLSEAKDLSLPVVICIAAKVGTTRLIDNIIVG